MIAEFFINLGRSLLHFLIGWLPASTVIPSGVYTALNTAAGYYPQLNKIIPLYECFVLLLFVWTLEIAFGMWKVINWIFDKFTGTTKTVVGNSIF